MKSFRKQNSNLIIHSKPDRNQSKLTVCNVKSDKVLSPEKDIVSIKNETDFLEETLSEIENDFEYQEEYNEEKSETFTSQIYAKLDAIEFQKIGSWFQCSECIYSSKRKQNLYNHFQTNHMDYFNEQKLAETPNLPKFVCPKCKLPFTTRILLSMTTLLEHSAVHKAKFYY